MAEDKNLSTIQGWFAGRVPDGWFTGPPEVSIRDDQVVVIGTLSDPAVPADAPAELRTGAEAGRIARFREETRRYRIWIAREAEARFDKNVTWGARSGGTTKEFTPGGSGRGSGGSGEPEPQKVMIALHRLAMHRWAARHRGRWVRSQWASGDIQRF
jgi:hypothetical protein